MKSSNILFWIICLILAIVGIGMSIRAILNFNEANVVVEWTTATELNTVGFNLLRGGSPGGPFEQANSTLIPAASDALTGNTYSFEDQSVEAGKTYFYMLEEIESNGSTNQHGPITVKANSPAKIELLIGILLLFGASVYGVVLIREQKTPATTQQ